MARSLEEILSDVVQHGKDNPNHGFNCTCMDQFIREVRDQVKSVIADTPGRDPFNRVYYVFSIVTRTI